MADMSREKALELGHLIDYSDIAAPLGIRWPFAISQQVEIDLYTSLPEGLSLDGQERALISAVTSIIQHLLALMKDAATNPELANRHQLSMVMPMAWREGEVFSGYLLIELDGDRQPAFTLYASEEDAA